jgi:hypothetical protein
VYLLVLIKFSSVPEDVISFLKPLGFSGISCVMFTHISRTVYCSDYEPCSLPSIFPTDLFCDGSFWWFACLLWFLLLSYCAFFDNKFYLL